MLAQITNLLAPVVRQSAKGFLAHKYMKDAQRLGKLGRLEESIAFYKKAIEYNEQTGADRDLTNIHRKLETALHNLERKKEVSDH